MDATFHFDSNEGKFLKCQKPFVAETEKAVGLPSDVIGDTMNECMLPYICFHENSKCSFSSRTSLSVLFWKERPF